MTYEEFKKNLYRNLLMQEELKNKEFKVYEKNTVFEEMRDLQIIRALNLSCFGTEEEQVPEDVICALWEQHGRLNMIHWKLRTLYERYKAEGWQGVLPEMLAKLKLAGSRSKLLFAENASYEECFDRLILRPINLRRHIRELDNCIYWSFGDIAIVLYGIVSEKENECVTLKIQRDFTTEWKMSDESLLTNALLNTFEKMPPRLFKAGDMELHPIPAKGVFMPGEKGIPIRVDSRNRWQGIKGYRLTTVKHMNGALAIFYPGVRKRLAELMGGDYYVGFTSIHEAVIHPVRYKNVAHMKEAIAHVNAVFDEREMLTNRVYRYSDTRDELMEV